MKTHTEKPSLSISNSDLQMQEKEGTAGTFFDPPPLQLKANSNSSNNVNSHTSITSGSGSKLPFQLKESSEQISGISMDDVNVHYNSKEPEKFNAHAFAQGTDIHLAPGQEKHLPHETWHVVQQKQNRVIANKNINGQGVNADSSLEKEADVEGEKLMQFKVDDNPDSNLSRATVSNATVQRQVRIGGGKTKVDEAKYQEGGAKENVGGKFKVADLISDGVKRVFDSESELEKYANGATDNIGDVRTKSKGTYWFRLPSAKLTVLGEYHQNEDGNVPDVILGLGTSRFKYEPYNEMESIGAITAPFDSTNDRLDQIDKGREVGPNVDKSKFNPGLENIVIKAMTGCGIVKNEFIASKPAKMSAKKVAKWSGRATTDDYSMGERAALYFTMAIHIARDISKDSYGDETMVERPIISISRKLREFYNDNNAILDDFTKQKDTNDLIGIYEMAAAHTFTTLTEMKEFCTLFHTFGARYIQELGEETKNRKLVKEGEKLEGKPKAKLKNFSPAREEIIWNKVLEAKKGGYMIVGMGDAHRDNLKKRIEAEGIPHEETTVALERQKKNIDSNWVD